MQRKSKQDRCLLKHLFQLHNNFANVYYPSSYSHSRLIYKQRQAYESAAQAAVHITRRANACLLPVTDSLYKQIYCQTGSITQVIYCTI